MGIPLKNTNSAKVILTAAGLAKDLDSNEIDAVLTIADEQHFARGVTILREDSKSRDLYIIRDGRVSIRLKLPSEVGREEVIYQMRDSQIFGELALVDGSPRSATVCADDDVVTYRIDYEKLCNLLETQPRIGYILMRNIAGIIANRVRNTNMLWRNSLIW